MSSSSSLLVGSGIYIPASAAAQFLNLSMDMLICSVVSSDELFRYFTEPRNLSSLSPMKMSGLHSFLKYCCFTHSGSSPVCVAK